MPTPQRAGRRPLVLARGVDDRPGQDGNVGTPELRLDGAVLDNAVAFDPGALDATLRR